MKEEILDIMMDSLKKTKEKFDNAIANGETFEASTYGHELTEMSKTLLEHYRSEHEAHALEQLMKKRSDKDDAC